MKNFKEIYTIADKAGRDAADKVNVIPMIVNQHSNMLDDNSKVVKSYYVNDGVCGFASIHFPARGKFYKDAVAAGVAKKNSYSSGASIYVGQYNQSLQLKEAYADAFAEVLRNEGINAYSLSRMD